MPLVLDGTNGVSGVDGTASNPAIEGTDSNTGIFYPAADTIAFAEGGTEVARFDSSGNFGIGTSSPGRRLGVTETNNTAASSATFWDLNYGGIILRNPSDTTNSVTGIGFIGGSTSNAAAGVGAILESAQLSALAFFTGGQGRSNSVPERMRISSSGNVGIGTSSPSSFSTYRYLDLVGGGTSTGGIFQSKTSDGAVVNTLYTTGSAGAIGTATNHPLQFLTNDTERARIGSTGILGLTQSTANGVYIRSESTVSIASNGTIDITVADAGSCVILVHQTSTGDGGMFWANYTATVTKIVGDGSATDAGATFAVYKSASSHTTTIRNRYGVTRSFKIAVYSASAAP